MLFQVHASSSMPCYQLTDRLECALVGPKCSWCIQDQITRSASLPQCRTKALVSSNVKRRNLCLDVFRSNFSIVYAVMDQLVRHERRMVGHLNLKYDFVVVQSIVPLLHWEAVDWNETQVRFDSDQLMNIRWRQKVSNLNFLVALEHSRSTQLEHSGSTSDVQE